MNLVPGAEGEKGIVRSVELPLSHCRKKQHMDEKHQQVFFASDCHFEDEPTKNKTIKITAFILKTKVLFRHPSSLSTYLSELLLLRFLVTC